MAPAEMSSRAKRRVKCICGKNLKNVPILVLFSNLTVAEKEIKGRGTFGAVGELRFGGAIDVLSGDKRERETTWYFVGMMPSLVAEGFDPTDVVLYSRDDIDRM